MFMFRKTHEAILAKVDRLIDETAQHVAAEEFRGVKTLPHKVALAIKRLEEARSNAFRNRQMVLTLEDKLQAAQDQRNAALDRLEQIAAQVTPGANATVKRMGAIAREAVESRPINQVLAALEDMDAKAQQAA